MPPAAAPVGQQLPQAGSACLNMAAKAQPERWSHFLKQVSAHNDASCLFLLLKSNPGRGRSLVSYLAEFLPQNAQSDQRPNTMTSPQPVRK